MDHEPRPRVRPKKRRRDRLIRLAGSDPCWAVGFEDETWWSWLALPSSHAWAEDGKPLRLLQRSVAKDDPDPKAISCYGLYLPKIDAETWLRFVEGRPVSGITTRFLSWCSEKLAALSKRVLVLVRDNASWHISKEVRAPLDRRAQPGGEEGQQGRRADRELLIAEEEPVTKLDKGQMGAW